MTGTFCTQVVHDALEIGEKARDDGVQILDHALSGTSALFANDKSPGTLVVGQLGRVAFPAGTMQPLQTSEWKRRLGKEGACTPMEA